MWYLTCFGYWPSTFSFQPVPISLKKKPWCRNWKCWVTLAIILTLWIYLEPALLEVKLFTNSLAWVASEDSRWCSFAVCSIKSITVSLVAGDLWKKQVMFHMGPFLHKGILEDWWSTTQMTYFKPFQLVNGLLLLLLVCRIQGSQCSVCCIMCTSRGSGQPGRVRKMLLTSLAVGWCPLCLLRSK